MSNLEKAKNMLRKFEFDVSISEFFYSLAFEAVNVASKPDWKYPEKNELPDNSKQANVIIIAFEYNTACGVYLDNKFCNLRDYEPFQSKVIAWCYLPQFENNQ